MDLNNITAEQQKGLEFLKVRFQAELDDIKQKIQQLNKPFPDDLTTHLQNSFLNKELLFSPSQQIGLKKDQRREQLEKLKGDENERQYLGRIKLSLDKFAEAGMRQELENKLLGIVQNSKLTSNKRMSAFFCLMHSLGFGFKRTSDFIVWAFGQMWVYENRRIAKERKAKLKKQKDLIKEQEKKEKIENINQEMTNDIKQNHDDSQGHGLPETQHESHDKNNPEQKEGHENQKSTISMGFQSAKFDNMNTKSQIQGGGDMNNGEFPKLSLANLQNNGGVDPYGAGGINNQMNGLQQTSLGLGGMQDPNQYNQLTGVSTYGGASTFQGNQSINLLELNQSTKLPLQQKQEKWLTPANNKGDDTGNQLGSSVQDPIGMQNQNMQYFMPDNNLNQPGDQSPSKQQDLQQNLQQSDDPKQQLSILQTQLNLSNLIQIKLNNKVKNLQEQIEEKNVQISQLLNLCENSKNTFQKFLINLFSLLQQNGVSQDVQTQVQNLAKQHQFVNTNKSQYETNMDQELVNIVGSGNNVSQLNLGGNNAQSGIDLQSTNIDGYNSQLNGIQQQIQQQNTKIEPKVEHVYPSANESGMKGNDQQKNSFGSAAAAAAASTNAATNSLLLMQQNNQNTAATGLNNFNNNLHSLSLTNPLGMQSNLSNTGPMQFNTSFNLVGGQSEVNQFNNDFYNSNINPTSTATQGFNAPANPATQGASTPAATPGLNIANNTNNGVVPVQEQNK